MKNEKTWAVLQHVPWEGPGLIERIGRERGIAFETCRMDLGETLPAASGIGGLVVMGGPMGVYEAERYPHLTAEMALIADCVRAGLPVLGVCLGSQLLAGALGARVFPGHGPEIGAGEVRLTAEGASDPVLGPGAPSFPAFHWHGDTFDLPRGAVLLGSSAPYPHQAFRSGRRAYAFQFHVEVDGDLARAWAPHLPEGVEIDEGRRAEIERSGRAILGRFFDV
jgi:GMP synthase-like glutamine amidotransferase